jgi:membrane complex biogenesis BtpA family protein
MVHLPALPGSADAALPLDRIIERAVEEARLLVGAGFDAVMIENFGDAPFLAVHVEPHTVAAMAIVLHEVRRSISNPIGVNVLRNDAMAGVALAAVGGADFLRVNVHVGVYATDQGIVEGRAPEVLRYRAVLGGRGAVLADVHVKHAEPLSSRDLAQAAEETAYRGRADALIVSGPTTGRPAAIEDLRTVKGSVPDRPVYVGSGADANSVGALLDVADGVIVGSSLKREGRTTDPLDPQRVEAFIRAARKR